MVHCRAYIGPNLGVFSYWNRERGGGGGAGSATEWTSYEQPSVLNGHFSVAQGWLLIAGCTLLFLKTILLKK